VLALRKSKSMILDDTDPNSRSVGSFFKNPVLAQHSFADFLKRCETSGVSGTVPSFPAGQNVKLPAAWLVEKAGFTKGFRLDGAGVSAHHSLALVNYCGTAAELLALADAIQSRVKELFGISLEREPVVVPP
jgi:UDP-N-acetylmuramate dehydrogenase